MEFPKEVMLPQKTIFASGASSRIAEESLSFGNEGLIVHGRSLEKSGKLEEILKIFPSPAKISTICRSSGEPDIEEVSGAVAAARKIGAKWIAGIGGGSALDLAKAAAGLYNAKENPSYYQEDGKLKERGIPFIAAPTTAGTGSEATVNSVIINRQKNSKLSIRDNSFLAKTVILDPELLKGTPKEIISSAGMDALVQAYEAYISKNSTRFTDMYALRALSLINQNILGAHKSPNDENLSAMLIGSYYAGIALAHARLGVIHGIAHPLGVLYGKPHGLICALCLPASVKLNREAMGKKYKYISTDTGIDFLERAQVLLDMLMIKSPFKGREIIEKEKIIDETLESSSTAANPKPITRGDVEFLLKELF
ncbi:MAG: iron-containing alcohol dehydrogenase [Elusimicrobiota bacterium]